MKKKAIALILALCMAVTLLPISVSAASGSEYFTDIPANAWYAKYIDVCYESGLMKGVGNNRFNPDGTVTNAEMLTVCARIHSLLTGKDGNIPLLPEEGVRGCAYFTDGEGNRVASYNDIKMFSAPYKPDLYLYFEDDVLADLQSNPITAKEITLVTLMPYERSDTLTYLLDENGRPAYFASFDEDDRFGVNLSSSLLRISTAALKIKGSGAWYDNTWCYLSWAYEETDTAADELMDIIKNDYPEVSPIHSYDPIDYKDMGNDCPRLLLAYFLATLIPEENLQPINSIDTIPDVNAELIRRLYCAGIMGGVDSKGKFDGHGTLTRAQLATVIARIVEPELRLKN